jgi:hypothetical protein
MVRAFDERHVGMMSPKPARGVDCRHCYAELPASRGLAKGTDRYFAKFVQIAIASSTELEYHLHFASDAELLPRCDFDAREMEIVEIRRMLNGLLLSLRGSAGSPD